MLTEDYVMRMIFQAVAALLKIAQLKQAGQYEQAQQTIDQALEQLLGLRADVLKQLDDETLLRSLTQNERLDVERLALVADLFKEQGDIQLAQGRQAEAQASYRRALTGYLETGLDEGGSIPDELPPKISALVQQLGLPALADDNLWALFLYEERRQDYTRAEEALLALNERPGVREELQPELIGFYERLLERTDEELAQSHLSRGEVEQKLERMAGFAADG